MNCDRGLVTSNKLRMPIDNIFTDHAFSCDVEDLRFQRNKVKVLATAFKIIRIKLWKETTLTLPFFVTTIFSGFIFIWGLSNLVSISFIPINKARAISWILVSGRFPTSLRRSYLLIGLVMDFLTLKNVWELGSMRIEVQPSGEFQKVPTTL